MKGSEWIESVGGKTRAEVMAAVLEAVEARQHVAWPMQEVDAKGGVQFRAAMDYFAIGEPTDFVRVPLDAPTAQAVADKLGYMLPTTRMVDHIWQAADVKLVPEPMSATAFATHGIGKPEGASNGWPYDRSMMSIERFALHNTWIEQQLAARGESYARLIAGHKKDVVLSQRLTSQPDRVAIYGLHRPDGRPIQGPRVSLRHAASYYDYSHGARYVEKTCRAGQVKTSVSEVLQDPELHSTLSSEGLIYVLRYGTASAPSRPKPNGERAASSPPVLRVGSVGRWVVRWQQIVGVTADGVFGRNTESATRVFQRARGLVSDGVVGPRTWAVGLGEEAATAWSERPKPVGFAGARYVEARHFTQVKGERKVDLIVLHSMEAAEKPDTAENVAAWFAGPNAPRASAHYCVDEDSVVASVRERHIAWAAPGTNHNGVHIEHAGYARQTSAEWADDYSARMLDLSAQLAASISRRHGVPLKFIDAGGLLAAQRGVTTHAEVSLACKLAQDGGMTGQPFYNDRSNRPRTNHYDPGPHFPIEHYLALARKYK